MERSRIVAARALVLVAILAATGRAGEPVGPTREFEVRGDRPFLGGRPVDLWGIRCANTLHSTAVTDIHINNFDRMIAHGINLIGVSIQGSNGGWPDPGAGLDGFRRDGRLRPEVADRLEALVRAADRRGMVVEVGILSPRKDQNLHDEAAIRRAIEEAGRFLVARGLKNVFVDLMHEFDQSERIDHALLREPDGAAKKARLTAVAPDVEVGVCPSFPSDTADSYPGMDVRIIQKAAPIPSEGFGVNIETLRRDVFEDDGVFNEGSIAAILDDCRRYLDAPNAVMIFHSAYTQGITNRSGTAPHPEAGGYGTSATDRGIRFYDDWVRDHVGRYEYPDHIQADAPAGRQP